MTDESPERKEAQLVTVYVVRVCEHSQSRELFELSEYTMRFCPFELLPP